MPLYQPTEQDVAELAKDMLGGHVYNIEQVPEHNVLMIFMFLIFGSDTILDDLTEEEKKDLIIFSVYGKDQTTGTAINGYPCFLSGKIWPRSAYIKAQEKAKAAEEVLFPKAPKPKVEEFFAANPSQSMSSSEEPSA
jgi:hypothetical protein